VCCKVGVLDKEIQGAMRVELNLQWSKQSTSHRQHSPKEAGSTQSQPSREAMWTAVSKAKDLGIHSLL
jgi:hypothetical protein